ncbi:MAG: cytochrome P450 [Acidimicrobiales bacterium]
MSDSVGPDIDLLDFHRYAGSQPHDDFDWLRVNDPVHRHPEPDGGPGFWALTRHDDVQAVGRDTERFSSRPTIMIPDGPTVADDEHVMMLMADPPIHTRMRRLVSRRFTPRAAAALSDRVAELAARIVDEVVADGSCDAVTDLAGEMPSFVIADILGIPLVDGRDLYRHTETLHAAPEAVTPTQRAEALAAMAAYAGDVYRRRRADPAGDDLGSLIANGTVAGRPTDETDFFLWFLLLIDAGGDTTRNLVGAGLHALFANDDQLALLTADPAGRLDRAIEELLRYVSPVVHMRRTATVDTELGGRPIRAGDKVVMFYGAANRDPATFDEPHRLDIDRRPNPHVAFGGGGPHFCLGAHLARLEIRALLAEMLTRLDDLAPAGPASWMSSNFVFGPTSLPISFRPGPRRGDR